MMSSITPNTPRPEPEVPGAPSPTPGPRRSPGGFWSFLKTLFVGTAGLAVLGVVGTLGGSIWLANNQKAEADKAQPWTDPSLTTIAVTTGGMLARWMDNDGNPENGHSYIQGIYNLWKVRQTRSQWENYTKKESLVATLPPLWRAEFTADVNSQKAAYEAEMQRLDTKNTRDGLLSMSREGIRQLNEEDKAREKEK